MPPQPTPASANPISASDAPSAPKVAATGTITASGKAEAAKNFLITVFELSTKFRYEQHQMGNVCIEKVSNRCANTSTDFFGAIFKSDGSMRPGRNA
jgi:hypothetical protein